MIMADSPETITQALGMHLDDAQRELAYSPSSAIGGNYQPYIREYVQRSAAAYAALPQHTTLRYGALPRQCIDFFPAPENAQPKPAGLLVFIHGGYWQELSKNESAFLAPAWHTAGFAHAVLGYTLAPQISVSAIAQECIAALQYLRVNASDLGFDADRIVVAGSSAGGFLTAACGAEHDLQLRGIVTLSGIFNLQPLIGTSINAALLLDHREATALTTQALRAKVPALIAWGEQETSAFKAQSALLAQQLQQRNVPAQSMEIAGRNHFDVVHELGDAHSPLFAATLQLFN